MDQKLPVGTRVLFTTHSSDTPRAGTIVEYSPSNKYVGVYVGHGEHVWCGMEPFTVLETLGEDPEQTAYRQAMTRMRPPSDNVLTVVDKPEGEPAKDAPTATVPATPGGDVVPPAATPDPAAN